MRRGLVTCALGTLVAALPIGCGEPSLIDACADLCEHDRSCGLEQSCEAWARTCAQLTADGDCVGELRAYHACADADDACLDGCNAEFLEWIVCVSEAPR
jgi:hypothetical protein